MPYMTTQQLMDAYGVSWFKMDEATGTSLIDSKGSAVGTASGSVTAISGYSGNAKNFNSGLSQYFRFNTRVLPLGKKSIRFKIRTTNTAMMHILSTAELNSSHHGDLIMLNGGFLQWWGLNGTSNLRFNFDSTISLSDGLWHDVLLTWDGTTNADMVKMYIDDMYTPHKTSTASTTETTTPTYNFAISAPPSTNNSFFSGDLDEVEIYNTNIVLIPPPVYKTLILHGGVYKKYTGSSWQTETTSSTVTELDYLNGNTLTELSAIPESAWSQLTGTVELCYYTDDAKITEASFNIETNPFTLADEWGGENVSVIEYTDDLAQTESIVTIETDPFSLYDEIGDSFDVLYYTDDTSKASANLELNAMYSPLDEITQDFDVVTYYQDDKTLSDYGNLNYKALPFAQLVLNPSDLEHYGDIQKIVASKANITSLPEGKIKFMISFDSGVTWKVYRKNTWTTLYTSSNTTDSSVISKNGMTIAEINAIPTTELVTQQKFRLGYYIEEATYASQEAKLGQVKVVSKETLNDVKFHSMAFYLLNTTATIDLTFSGNRVTGVLDDADKTRVRYRALLNGAPLFPANGEFTTLQDAPSNIKLILDDRKVRFGEQNTLIVQFEDAWGQTDSWQTTFMGSYSGLLFTDESGSFLTTGFGEVLKKLDFGQIIAGTTTFDQKFVLINRLGYPIKNVRLQLIQPNLNGVVVEISKNQSPFIPITDFTFPEVMEPEDTLELYVRIVTNMTAQETPSGNFELRVNVDRVS